MRVKVIMGVLALSALMDIAGTTAGAADARPRDWTVEDSVKLRLFTGEQFFIGENYKDAIRYSPDRRYVSVVTQRGDIGQDMNTIELSVYALDSLEQALKTRNTKPPAPVARTRFQTFLNFVRVEWQSDSAGVRFNRADKDVRLGRWSVHGPVAQMHILEIASGKSRRMSTRTGTPSAFRDDGAVVGWLEGEFDDPQDETYYPFMQFGHQDNGLIDRPSFFAAIHGKTGLFFRGQQTMEIPATLSGAWIAPGGRHAVALLADFSLTPFRRTDPVPRFFLMDMENGKSIPMGSAITAAVDTAELPKPGALWSQDGTQVLLVNATVEGTGASQAIAHGLVEYDISGAKMQTMPMTRGYRWHGQSIDTSTAPATEAAEAPGPDDIQVLIEQSANREPTLVATDGRRRLALSDPDPALNGLWRTPVQSFEWQDPDGSIQKGALLLPRSMAKDRPLPLVIQVQHHVDLNVFAPDGTSSNGYAAQTYAANGMAVLMVPYPLSSQLPQMPDGRREGAITVARLDAAVAALAKQIPIDRQRIGLIGHSRCGFMIHYVITHPGQEQFAAAAMMDSYTGGYPLFLEMQSEPDSEAAKMEYGGDFWSHKASWLQHETTFNVDRVRTPALFTINTAIPQDTASSLNASIGAFNANSKPVETLWFPTATHNPARPRERLAVMGASVDWMMFWLKDQPPADPTRAASWAPLRRMQDAVLKTPPPPKGRWVFIEE